MSMFDYFQCHYPLPSGPAAQHYPKADWQTKDLECDLNTYRLTEEGELVEVGVLRENAIVHEPYTGTVNFYDRLGRWWVDVYAEFEDGWLQSIRVEAQE